MVAKPRRVTPAEYVAFEERSLEKHEYVRGQVFAMAGADPKHVLVCSNLARALGNRLEDRPCVVLPSDQAVYVEAADLSTYPDIAVVCGPIKTHRSFPRSAVNPSILIEVLSPSTAAYDRGAKFDAYRLLDTLQEYVLVSSERCAVDHYLREANGTWRLAASRGLDDSVRFPSIDALVPLREIYAKIELVAPEGLGDSDTPRPPPVDVPRR